MQIAMQRTPVRSLAQEDSTCRRATKPEPHNYWSLCSRAHEPQLLSPPVCPTLCDPMDCSLTGSSVHGILQARILEWVARILSELPLLWSSWPRDWTQVSGIAGRFFTIWAPGKPHRYLSTHIYTAICRHTQLYIHVCVYVYIYLYSHCSISSLISIQSVYYRTVRVNPFIKIHKWLLLSTNSVAFYSSLSANPRMRHVPSHL